MFNIPSEPVMSREEKRKAFFEEWSKKEYISSRKRIQRFELLIKLREKMKGDEPTKWDR
jgi:hypothetical protein